MKRYLIKVTYQEGSHAGKSYLLRKEGYVTDEDSIQWTDTTYKTEGIAKRICKHLFEENELNKRCERQDEACRIKKGLAPKKFHIYNSCTFEPYEVDVVA